jgi:predicted transcriptional regulator
LPAEEIESIEAGMADFENGRVITHAEAMAQVNEHIAKSKTGG